jgi:hypothetical protein
VTPRIIAGIADPKTQIKGPRRPAINTRLSETRQLHIHAHIGEFKNTRGQTNIERIEKQQRAKETIKKPGHARQTPTQQKLAKA